MPSLPIWWIRARAYCQATEDESRVDAAIDVAVPGGPLTRDRLSGEFGNPVLVLSRRIEGVEHLKAAWRGWADAGIVQALEADLDARLDDDGILHFRLDKQEAAEGRLSFLRDGDAIDVQVKVKAYPAKPEQIRRVARSLVTGAV